MILAQTQQQERLRGGAAALPPPSAARLRRRLFSGGCTAASEALAAKTAVFSGFLSDKYLSAAHVPPPASPSELGSPLTGPPNLLGTLNVVAPRQAQDAGAMRPGLVDCCLSSACDRMSLPPLPASATCQQEAERFSAGEPLLVDNSVAVDTPTPLGGEGPLASPRKPSKRGPLVTPRLLQLPLGGRSGKGRRKPQLLSPSACRVLDVSSSPLSVFSQASTSCALLSSASSLDSCSQPATPDSGLLDSAVPSPVPSGPHSPLPLTAPLHSAGPATTPSKPAAEPACEALPQEGQGLPMRARGVCSYEVHICGDSSSQADQQPGEAAAGAASTAGAGSAAGGQAAAKGADAPAAAKGLLQLPQEASPSESTVATSFLSSPTPTAAPSPLRLPIPARGLRRLQHPRLQQQESVAAMTAEETETTNNTTNPPRSLRRLQLPRLRGPSAPEGVPLSTSRGRDAERGENSNIKPRQPGGLPSLAEGALECTYSSADGSFLPPSQGAPAECASYGGGCSHGAPAAPRGGPLGEAFEAAAHAAHVAAHAAARAAAHAAAHAAVLKRRAAEAYWCSRTVSQPTFRIYPDLDRDIHLDYDLYCASWPDAQGPSLSVNSSQETADSMAIDAPSIAGPAGSGGDPKGNKGGQGHLVLGEGRYGKVVLAKHKSTHEMVAVKMLDKRRALADDAWDCRQELEVHRRLPHHPHVVSVLDVYEDRKSLYILMELCDRNTLVDRIVSDGAFTEEQAKLVFAQLLSGVMHCHNNNIVHRDLKPENILFAREVEGNKYAPPSGDCWSRSSTTRLPSADCAYPSYRIPYESQLSPPASCGSTSIVKITDFGSACYAVPGELNGTACGTIHYLAPEVLAGNYYDGFLSDVWSLGVILYIIISATPPFYGESDGEVVQKIVSGSYSMSGYQWRHVSDECKDIIRRLLTVDPRCRLSLNEAITHPWFIRATGGRGWPLPMLTCARCSMEDSSYEGVGDEGPLDEDFEGPCCCGNCHGDRCEAPALVLSPRCRFSCCARPTGSEPWASARPRGFIDWPRN